MGYSLLSTHETTAQQMLFNSHRLCLNLVNCLPREHNSVTFRRAEYFWPLGAKREAGRKSADSPQHSDTSVLVNMCLYRYVSKPENMLLHFVVTFKNIKRLMEQDSSSLRNRHKNILCVYLFTMKVAEEMDIVKECFKCPFPQRLSL